MNILGNLVEKLLHQNELWEGYCRYWIIINWGMLVGEKIAQVSEARETTGEVLRVTVRDAIWTYHLCLLKPRIIRKIKARFPDTTIKDIYFQVGDLPKKEKATGKREYKTGTTIASSTEWEQDQFIQKIRLLREQCVAPPES